MPFVHNLDYIDINSNKIEALWTVASQITMFLIYKYLSQ